MLLKYLRTKKKEVKRKMFYEVLFEYMEPILVWEMLLAHLLCVGMGVIAVRVYDKQNETSN